MPKVDEAIEKLKVSAKQRAKQSQIVLEYLDNHPDEVFRPADREELASKANWTRNVSSIPGVLIELWRQKEISRAWVKGRCFYGSHRAIELLRSRLPEASEMKPSERRFIELQKRMSSKGDGSDERR